ncbi:putative tail protein [Rhizobium phage vB_RglS_P106B]|uniref:Putative tail protein n=1 Tax=Rhizobium phage vB_RglS_P106B TaxID=1458697 RepID=W6E8L3_9CAUD|nr:tail protein [Rhizobium phage vB_RglS_P106B]AHJ10719.1 putative tail protein [Rhizobium phage vB_RglS_P106B]
MAKRFGREFKFDVVSPAEAVRFLCYQLEGFEAELRKGAYRVYRIYANGEKRNIDEDLLTFQFGKAIGVRIEPVIEGRKRGGIGKIILGIVLIGAAFFFSGGALGATAFTAFGNGVTYGQIALVGGLMALSGAAQMLAPKVSTNTDQKEEKGSFLISAPENKIEQGHPVPLVYGLTHVGTVMASAGISVEEYDDDED